MNRSPILFERMSRSARARRYGLVEAWSLGDLNAAYSTHHLTNNNAAAFVPGGKLGAAVDLELSSSQSLSVADTPALSGGVGSSLWLSAWFNPESIPATLQHIAGKLTTGTNQREYRLILTGTTSRFGFGGSAAGTSTTNANATTFGAATIGVWHHLFGYYDPNTSLLGIAVNGGPFDTASLVGGIFDGSGPFTIGAQGSLAADFADGMTDGVAFGKNPPLGMTYLRNEIRDYLWRGGAGRETLGGWT